MFNKLMKEFNSARKNGTIDKVTHQQKFTFSFPELGIENVDLLLHKTALDQRFKVNVLLNLNDRRSIIFPDEEIDRARCIIGVCAPIANYDIAGHNERERLRKDAIEQIKNELQTAHFEEAISKSNAPKEIAEELHSQINSAKAAICYRNCEEIRRYPINFNDLKQINSFTYVLYASVCMICEHFEKEISGKNVKVGRLPSQFFFYYVSNRGVDRLPSHIKQVKDMLFELNRYYSPFRFYTFCDWLANLFSKVPGCEREIMLALEQRRYDERQERSRNRRHNGSDDRQSAPSDKPREKREGRKNGKNDRDDFESKGASRKAAAKNRRAAEPVQAKPMVGIGSMFGDVLDSVVTEDSKAEPETPAEAPVEAKPEAEDAAK